MLERIITKRPTITQLRRLDLCRRCWRQAPDALKEYIRQMVWWWSCTREDFGRTCVVGQLRVWLYFHYFHFIILCNAVMISVTNSDFLTGSVAMTTKLRHFSAGTFRFNVLLQIMTIECMTTILFNKELNLPPAL